MLPCLTLNIIRYGSRVKWSNPGKGVAPFSTPWCCSYWQGSLQVALNCSCQLYLLLYMIDFTFFFFFFYYVYHHIQEGMTESKLQLWSKLMYNKYFCFILLKRMATVMRVCLWFVFSTINLFSLKVCYIFMWTCPCFCCMNFFFWNII